MQLGSGVAAFQVREVRKRNVSSTCFFVLHTDGTEEDFSLRKCLNRLFPPPRRGALCQAGMALSVIKENILIAENLLSPKCLPNSRKE